MSKEEPLHLSHDAFMKQILSDRAAAISFMKTFLPVEVSSELDIENFRYVTHSYINKDLRERFADLLLEVPVKESANKVAVALLIELKSRKDKYVGFQLLEYVALGYKRQIAQKKDIQIILPVIYYHGKAKWEYRGILPFFKSYSERILQYVPQMEQVFIDLKQKSPDEIAKIEDDLLKTTLNIQLLRFLNQVDVTLLIALFEGLKPSRYGNHLYAILVYLYTNFDLEKEFSNFIQKIPEPIKSSAMTISQRLRAEGRAEGILEGKAEGISVGKTEGIEESRIDFVIKSYDNGIEIPLIAKITGLTEAEVEKIIEDHPK